MGFRRAGHKIPKPFALALLILLRVSIVDENFLKKHYPLAYFSTKSAKISRPIAFQLIIEIICLDSFVKTSVEGKFPVTYVDFR